MLRLVRAGVVLPVLPRVYRLAGAPPSWRQRALAACLSVSGDVAASHLSAACLWQVPSVARPVVELTVPRHRTGRIIDEVIVHRRALPPDDVTERWGIPTTTPARTLIDLSSTLGLPLLIRIHDDLVRARHLRAGELEGRLQGGLPLPRRGREQLAELVRRRRSVEPGGSVKEDWVIDTIVAAGLPAPRRNVLIELGGRLREVDAAYVDHRVAIEYDGWTVHADRSHFDGDREKAALLQLAGWIGLQVTAAWTAGQLVARVEAALASRGWRRTLPPVPPPAA